MKSMETSGIPPQSEWLEADGLGGFASGTVSGVRTRRYHALLLTASAPPAGRVVLVNGFDASLDCSAGSYELSSQQYVSGVVHPDGHQRIGSFSPEPWPRWIFKISESLRLIQELFVPHGSSAVVLSWKLEGETAAHARLRIRPFFSGRDFHGLQHENPAFNFVPRINDQMFSWQAYHGVPGVIVKANACYRHEPVWYRDFLYSEEQARGLDCKEDLAAPGIFEFDITSGKAILILAAEGFAPAITQSQDTVEGLFHKLSVIEEDRRRSFPNPLARAADAYIVQRHQGKTIMAGYPWFGDWGRDTFIALRGLCLATGRLDDAKAILMEWAGAVSEGMLPNRFPDGGETPEYNSVDASLWYIIAVHEFLEASRQSERCDLLDSEETLRHAVEAILRGYSEGTRYGIRLDDCGLLACGEPGVQLTWMDAKVGDWVVTPRTGKPVEIQALWLNALHIAGTWNARWQHLFEFGLQSFRVRFWNNSRHCLFDVIDCFHQRGTVDMSIRPNQILAVGGLPLNLLEPMQAASVLRVVEDELWTPLGLRSLGRNEMNYAPRYEGGVLQRDGSYHQGTVWPWLAGPFVEAWVRVHGNNEQAREAARRKFLNSLLEHLNNAGIGHLPEIADAEVPHTPRGCPFQAWSVSELIRLQESILKK